MTPTKIVLEKTATHVQLRVLATDTLKCSTVIESVPFKTGASLQGLRRHATAYAKRFAIPFEDAAKSAWGSRDLVSFGMPHPCGIAKPMSFGKEETTMRNFSTAIIPATLLATPARADFDCKHFTHVEAQMVEDARSASRAMLQRPHDYGNWMREAGRIQGVQEIILRLQAEC
jgi:hypothetical protein